MVTIAEIAREAGCSTYVVSCALRGVGHVSAGKRARVLEVAAALGYRPNGPAALLAMQRHAPRAAVRQVPVACLGVAPLTTGLRSTWRSFEAAAAEGGLEAHAIRARECADVRKTLDRLWARGIEGILLRPDLLEWTPEEMAAADWRRFCVVKQGRELPALRFHLIRQSGFDCMMKTLEEGVARGYRRMAVVLERFGSERDQTARVGAFLAFRAHRAPRGTTLSLKEFPVPADDEAVLGWVLRQRPDAVIVYPFSLQRIFREAGLDDPARLGMATLETFGPFPGQPALSGCLTAGDEYGRRAAAHLVRMLRTGERGMVTQPLQEVIEPTWYEGETLPFRK